MKKVYHRKLIRDKIPQIIESNNEAYKTRVLNEGEFEIELKKKLLEEAEEVQSCTKEEMVNELADVLELIQSIAKHYKIPFRDVQKHQMTSSPHCASLIRGILMLRYS